MAGDLIEFLKDKDVLGFQPHPQYSAEGDFLTFFFQNEDCHGERVDDLLTVYRAEKSGELVGCKIKGVRRILSTMGHFGLTVEEPPISLGVLFLAGMAVSGGDRQSRKYYETIGERTRNIPLPARQLQFT